MKKLLLFIFLIPILAFAVTGNKVWRVSPGGTLPSWGPINLADGTNAVTGALPAKSNLPAVGQQVSSSTGLFNTSSASYVDVTNATVTITTTGRPVILMLLPDGASPSSIGGSTTAGTSGGFKFSFNRAGATIAEYAMSSAFSSTTGEQIDVPSSSMWYLDAVAAGTYVYKVQAALISGAISYVKNAKLYAFEL